MSHQRISAARGIAVVLFALAISIAAQVMAAGKVPKNPSIAFSPSASAPITSGGGGSPAKKSYKQKGTASKPATVSLVDVFKRK